MASGVKYTPYSLGPLARSAAMSAMCVAAAQRGRDEAERISPRDTGDYASSFRVRSEMVRAGYSNEPRAGAVLENVSDHAAAVEWRHGHHVLARVVDTIEDF